MKLVSIIIPVYNAEKYLRQCIDSIIKQSFDKFELILIDDGSKDKSGQICDEYAQRDNRIKVFHLQNGGPSKARNFGMSVAEGQYIEFVDSDDQLEASSLEYMAEIAQKYRPDMLIANAEIIDVVKDNKKIISMGETGNLDTLIYLKNLTIQKKAVFLHYIWNRWYKKEYIENEKIVFDEAEQLGEDFIFNCEMIKNKPEIVVLDKTLYKYYKRDNGSLSGKFIPNEITRRRKMDGLFKNIFKIYGIEEECKQNIDEMIGAITLASIQGVFSKGAPQNLKNQRKYVNEFLNSEYYEYIRKYKESNGELAKSEKISAILLVHKKIYIYLMFFNLYKKISIKNF